MLLDPKDPRDQTAIVVMLIATVLLVGLAVTQMWLE